jgi:hypothetical protein
MEKYLLLAMRGCMFTSGIHNYPRLMAFPQHHPLQCAAGSSAVAQATNIVFLGGGLTIFQAAKLRFFRSARLPMRICIPVPIAQRWARDFFVSKTRGAQRPRKKTGRIRKA